MSAPEQLDWLNALAPGRSRPVQFDQLPGVGDEDFLEPWTAFAASCRAILSRASPCPEPLKAVAAAATQFTPVRSQDAREWLAAHFTAHQILPHVIDGRDQPFVTGYFEPELQASADAGDGRVEPARARPHDLVDGAFTEAGRTYSAARRRADGSLTPYWSRAEIDAGQSVAPPLVWLRDAVELFIAQVQGSARLRFDDGRLARLVFDGKNGHPYASVGKLLIDRGYIAPSEMKLERLCETLRRLMRDPSAGRAILHHNPSYVFFSLLEESDPARGPFGSQGLPLTPFRSLAVDAAIWPLGLPVWISGMFPWSGTSGLFRKLMIAQDTGSAIVGPGRGDIFCGSGAQAGNLAGLLRHTVDFFVFAPRHPA